MLEGEQLSLCALSWYSPWCNWIFDGYEYHRSSAQLREVRCLGRKVRSSLPKGHCWACSRWERFERLWDVAGADGKKTRGNGQSLLLLREPASCWRQGSSCRDVVGWATYKPLLLSLSLFLILHFLSLPLSLFFFYLNVNFFVVALWYSLHLLFSCSLFFWGAHWGHGAGRCISNLQLIWVQWSLDHEVL